MLNPELNIGDRIVLINMNGETQVSYGDIGTVKGIQKFTDILQYQVNWDNGSKLSLLADADKWMKENDFIEMMDKKKRK